MLQPFLAAGQSTPTSRSILDDSDTSNSNSAAAKQKDYNSRKKGSSMPAHNR